MTLIGDAAHLFTPAAGMGANLALCDGLECGLVLAEAINGRKSSEEREEALARWEREKLFTEGTKWAQITARNLEAMYSPDAPASAVEFLSQALRLSPPRRG